MSEEGFTIAHASTGTDGWHALQGGEWDLVLLDWWIPEPDGYAILRRLRSAGDTTPVLFLTARDAVSDRVRGLEGGADDYLCKPFAFEELVARVRALSRRKAPPSGTSLRYEDVELDLLTRHTCLK